MNIKSLAIDKGDYGLEISYIGNNGDENKIATNDAPLQALKLAIGCVEEDIRQYLHIEGMFKTSLKSVKFDESPTVVIQLQELDRYPPKIAVLTTRLHQAGKQEHDIEPARAQGLINIEELRGECERFINGERANQELDLGID